MRARPAGAWSAGCPRSIAACGAWAARGRRRRPLRRRKERFNPLSLEPPAAGGTFSQFRDPTTAWREGGLWYTVIGVQANCIGGAAMYSSPDLRSWTYVGQLATQLGINNTAGLQCAAPPTPQPGNGACDQMGQDCHTWVRCMRPRLSALAWSSSPPRREPDGAGHWARAGVPGLLLHGLWRERAQVERPGAPARRPAPPRAPPQQPPGGALAAYILCRRVTPARRAQVRGRTPFAADWYMLSSADARANSSNVAAGGAIGAFNASSSYYGLALTPQCAPARAAAPPRRPRRRPSVLGAHGVTRRAARRAG